jgi:hypothetical protein
MYVINMAQNRTVVRKVIDYPERNGEVAVNEDLQQRAPGLCSFTIPAL